MAEVIRMPRMTDTMQSGMIVEWHKEIGDKIKPDDLICEIKTDKAVMDFESWWDGYLLYKGGETGQDLKTDAILCIIGKLGENIDELIK